ncbi:MAG: beta-ketoacyl synthase N-terminal-like domain-containing protein [Pseudonocardiaceae bacterium]
MSTTIVITGSSVISPAGKGARLVFDAMSAGKTFFDAGYNTKMSSSGSFPWPIAAVRASDFGWPDGDTWVNNKKYANIAAHGAVAAARLALKTAGTADGADSARCGTVIAVSSSSLDELSDVIPRLAAMAETDPRPLAKLLYDEVRDYSYIREIPSQLGQFVSMATGFRGSNVAVYGEAGAGGFGALALGARLLHSGELDRVLVVGVSPPLSVSTLVAFDRQEALGTLAGPGSGPFDVDRAGTLIGQGSAAIMLESQTVADARGVVPLAELRACETMGASTRIDAIDAAVRSVVDRQDEPPGLWWAHGAGSITLDCEECGSVGRYIDVPTTASKGTIGNAFECAGLIDVALAVEALEQEMAPPIGLLRKPDPQLGDIDFVHGAPRPIPGVRSVLVTTVSHGSRAAMAGAALVARRDRHA